MSHSEFRTSGSCIVYLFLFFGSFVWDTKRCLALQHALVPNTSAPESMERPRKTLKEVQCLNSLSVIFLGRPVENTEGWLKKGENIVVLKLSATLTKTKNYHPSGTQVPPLRYGFLNQNFKDSLVSMARACSPLKASSWHKVDTSLYLHKKYISSIQNIQCS